MLDCTVDVMDAVCVGSVPGDLDGRRIFANGEKAAEMFSRVEQLIAASGTRTSAPFTWLFMRPPWATTGACCKECVFTNMKNYANEVQLLYYASIQLKFWHIRLVIS